MFNTVKLILKLFTFSPGLKDASFSISFRKSSYFWVVGSSWGWVWTDWASLDGEACFLCLSGERRASTLIWEGGITGESSLRDPCSAEEPLSPSTELSTKLLSVETTGLAVDGPLSAGAGNVVGELCDGGTWTYSFWKKGAIYLIVLHLQIFSIV